MSKGESVNTAPFFIIGSGRSGTTLLRLILGSHSRLSIPPETWYLNKLPDLLTLDRPLTSQECERVVQVMTGHYRWPDLDFHTDEFRRRVAALKSPRLRDIVEIVYLEHLAREHKSRWGDKTPGYIELVPQLAQLFPGAKFIHVIRDGRDVAKSFQVRRWSGDWLHQNAGEWLTAMSCGERWKSSTLARQLLEVRYEDLVLDQENQVRRICQFLEEEFEPQMLTWHTNVENLVPAREIHIHEKLTQAPTSEDVGRWKRELRAREVLVCEALMGRHLKLHGYELHFAGRGWRPILWLTRQYCEQVLPVASMPLRAFRALKKQISAAFGGREAKAGHGS